MKLPKVLRLLCCAAPIVLLPACNDSTEVTSVPDRSDAPAVCKAALEWPHLLGSMHEHSGFSDGAVGTTPADYFAAGAELGLDFMGSAEHSDNARLPITANGDCASADLPACVQASPDGVLKWERTADMAAQASTPDFTAFRGFEWTSDRFGHINVYFSSFDWNAKTTTGYLISMEDFWLWFGLPADLLGGNDGLAVFNHPGREDTLHAACEELGPLAETCGTVYNGDPAYNWNDFEYRAEVAQRVVGIEMYGKSGDYYDGDNGAPEGGWYAHALRKGWHLGPIGAEDEHGQSWARPERAKTIMIAPDRSPDSLKQAMLARRFYALAHAYNDVRVEFSARPALETEPRWPMGSRVSLPAGRQMTFSVNVSGVASPRIELVGAGGIVAAAANGAELTYAQAPDQPEEQWLFARVIDTADQDGDERLDEVVAVTAPIWFAQGEDKASCDGSAFTR
nr:hypothetical protein [Oceanococcus sp. HetDA_MAG_MS8]